MKLSSKVQEATYLVAQIIVKNKVPHSIAESSIKESCCAIVQKMFGPEFEVEVKKFLWQLTQLADVSKICLMILSSK